MPKRWYRPAAPPEPAPADPAASGTPPLHSSAFVQRPEDVPAQHAHRPEQQAIEVTVPDTARTASSRSSGMSNDYPRRGGP